MDEFEKVGKRVKVSSLWSNTDLGLGTYLWMGEILLDTGKKINEQNCQIKFTEPSEVPPLHVVIHEDIRVFVADRGNLRNMGHWLKEGEQITILEIGTRGWNHGRYVTGRFVFEGESYFVLISELALPEETHPHLRSVS